MLSDSAPPVFVHSSFRVSSTWFWIKFRELASTRAYYEVFHERLASVTRESIGSFNTDCWESRHPPTGPYFAEYIDLIDPSGGVRGYRRAMAFAEFVPAGGLHGELPAATTEYVRMLAAHARSHGRVPVLTCSRSLGRIAGLRQALGGYHILLIRNLYHQWLSYLDLTNRGTYYFLNATLSTLINGRADPFLSRLCDECVQEEACADGRVIVRFVNVPAFLRAVVGLHLYLYMAALPHVDLVVDVTALACDPRERERVADEICEGTDLALDLADARDVPVVSAAMSAWDVDAAVSGLVERAASTLGLAAGRQSAFGADVLRHFDEARRMNA